MATSAGRRTPTAASPGRRPISSTPSKTSRPERKPGDRRLYGRGAGRALSPRRAKLVEKLLPKLALPEEGRLDPAALIPGKESCRLEIGFGGGEHLAAQAERNPDAGFIGVEPFLDGVAKALDAVQEAGVENVRVHRGDGRDVLERLTGASLDAVYVLFPDPWPKTRHWKRRLIQVDTLDQIARVLAPGGRLRVATDVASYVDWTLFLVRRHPAFAWTARRPADWRTPPDDHVRTRYEKKNIGDIAPTFLDFERG